MSSQQPERPGIKSSWKESEENGFTLVGPIILNKGESTNNGKIGVRLLDIVPAKCASPFAEYPDGPKAVLQFYKPSSNEVFGETKFSRGNSSLDDLLALKINFDVLEVIAINSQEKWVEFDLRYDNIDSSLKLRPQSNNSFNPSPR